jgi:hypothetical protein
VVDWPSAITQPGPILNISSWSYLGFTACVGLNIVPVSTVYPLAHRILYYPFRIPIPVLIEKLAWLNGATVSGNVDLGIFDDQGNKITSTGSTAQAGASAIQEVDIANITLDRGLYYLGFQMDNVTGTLFRQTRTQVIGQLLGLAKEDAGAFGLPALATFAALGEATYDVLCFATARVRR